MLPRVEPTTIRSILEDGNLPRLAALVRTSTQTITPEYVAELPQRVAGNMDSFLKIDLAGTSWQGMKAYTQHDFGFGVPKALRWPNPAVQGCVFIFPSRACIVGGDEGLEICVCLEKSSADRLMEDESMLKYAQPRV